MKKEYLILAAIIVVLGAYLFFQDANRSQYELPTISKVVEKEITKMEIEKAGKPIVLHREGEDWTIGEEKFPADMDKIKQMLAVIENFKLTALVSTSKAYSRYDLTEDKRVAVKASAGDVVVRAFDIGKEAETYQHTFVKLAKDSNVYHAQNNFKRSFDVTIDSLRDKKVLSLNPSDIIEIMTLSGDTTISLTRKEVPVEEKNSPEGKEAEKQASAEADKEKTKILWQDADGNAVNGNSVDEFLSKFSHITCDAYINDKTKDDFKTPTHTVTLKGLQTYTLKIYEKKDTDDIFPAVSSQNNYPFSLSKSLVDQIKNGMNGLLSTKKES